MTATATRTDAEAAEPLAVPDSVDTDTFLEISRFYTFEAELLDDRRFRDWYNLLADDVSYWMPTRSNRTVRELDRENSAPGELSNFDDDKTSMGWRVKQLESGMHWAEDPPSRTRHLITNLRVQPTDQDDEYATQTNFLCYRNRLETEVDLWVGQRNDVLRRVGPATYQIARRTILLDQNVVLSKNLSVFL